MINDNWGRTRRQKQILLAILLLLIVTGSCIFFNLCFGERIGEDAESVAVIQIAGTIYDETMQEEPTQYRKEQLAALQTAVQSGWTLGAWNGSLRDGVWHLLTGILPENGYLQVANGIPLLYKKEARITKIIAEEEAYYASALISDIWKHSFEKVGNLTLSEDVQVILYHTHNAETYLPDDGVSKVAGKNGGVVQAAQVFQDALQKKYGIRTAHSTTIHDYPDWSRSYQNSLHTAKQLLQAYPTARAVFDVHRDAGFTSKKTTTATVHGRSAAKIMMVIGCNHDNWQENLAFARLLEAKCNELYPGLLRESIRIKETGRYNQQVDGHAVLLEIGSDLNTQAEAEYSMECFAHVVYEVLAELE